MGEILHRADDHLIFIDQVGNLQWLYDSPPAESAWIHARVAELEARCAFFKETGLPGPIRWFSIWNSLNHERSAKRFIAQGIVVIFSGGTKAEAETAFNSAEAFILQRGRETSLVWLYVTFGILALGSLVTLITLIFSVPQTELSWAVLTCGAAGGIGAYISRALASRTDLPCDANAGWFLHVQEAVLRWSVGVVAGGLMCLLVGGKVLLGGLDAGGVAFPAVLALATFSGMSERFLPTLLNRFDDQLRGAGPGP